MIVYGFDPITRDDFPLIVEDAFGGAETAAHTLRVFHELALRHRITFWELLQMLKVATLGPASLDPDYIPLSEVRTLRAQMECDAVVLAQPHCPLEFAVAAWERAQRYCQMLAQHHPNPDLRARYAAEYEEHQCAMADAIAWAKARAMP
jgi:hypothetical protein